MNILNCKLIIKPLSLYVLEVLKLFVLILALSSCTVDDNAYKTVNQKLDSIVFEKANNPLLKSDVVVPVTTDDTLYVFIPDLERTDSLVPTINVDTNCKMGGVLIESGKTVVDFTSFVNLEVEDPERGVVSKIIKLVGNNGIPRLDIFTENDTADVISKDNYVGAELRFSNCPDYGPQTIKCKLKGRGHNSWTYPKKPYRIKLNNKCSVLGMRANKDWILLADYSDKSLMRTVYMCEVSKALEMKYTVDYRHLDVYLNREYLGTYLLTEKIEDGKNKVEIEKDGFILEYNSRYKEESCFFITDLRKIPYTFKYPDADKKEIIENDDNYNFIVGLMNDLEKIFEKIPYGDKSYQNYIDLQSYAKWFIAQEVLHNWDPNIYMVKKNREEKFEMGPLWDFEWSLGLAGRDTHWQYPPTEPRIDVEIWREYYHVFYKELCTDIEFLDVVKKEWNQFKKNIPNVKKKVDEETRYITYSQQRNFEKWDILSKYISVGLIALGDWDKEVSYCKTFFDQRVEWCDKYFNETLFQKLANKDI